jgi:hypothetical protein
MKGDLDFVLEELEQSFLASENPLFLMNAFVLARHHSKIPPNYLLDFVAMAFDDYLKKGGVVSLDKIFGLKKGKGQTPAVKDAEVYTTDYLRMLDIVVLLDVFHKTLSDAVEMVYRKHATTSEYEEDIECSGADTLAQKFTRNHWKAKLKKDRFCQWYILTMTGKTKDDYLKSFPE